MSVCAVVGPHCTAPAGYRTGLGIAKAPSQRLPRCWQCGEPVCRNCSTGVGRSRICLTCQAENAKVLL